MHFNNNIMWSRARARSHVHYCPPAGWRRDVESVPRTSEVWRLIVTRHRAVLSSAFNLACARFFARVFVFVSVCWPELITHTCVCVRLGVRLCVAIKNAGTREQN